MNERANLQISLFLFLLQIIGIDQLFCYNDTKAVTIKILNCLRSYID
ncbi:hypothetical protein LPICM17_500133 [Lactococcus piscium]|nr:hypothetical protein LPICM17_500133 [Lactococcus piscium]